MKIKSLLLGSAAALIAVSGAQAADVVIVEPEPVEYVRICDAYGAGFFYIPGTETCLKFSGYVRVDYSSRHIHEGYKQTKIVPWNGAFGHFEAVTVTKAQRHQWQYRARFNIDARNETEWGTLRSQIRFQGDGGNNNSEVDVFSNQGDNHINDANVGLDRALISLAGFRVGYSDDYWTTIGGYGYYDARYDGNYGYTQGLFLDYTYAADGFTATIGVSDNRRSGTAGQPDVYVGADYSGSWGRVFGTYHYDSNQAAGAYYVGFEQSLGDYIPGGSWKAWYMADDGDTDYVKGHSWGVSAKMDMSDNFVLFAGYGDYDCGTKGCTTDLADRSYTDMTVGVRWNMTPGLYMQLEYAKENYDTQKRGYVTENQASAAAAALLGGSRLSTGTVNLRLVRSF
jgi:hypothetical protein